MLNKPYKQPDVNAIAQLLTKLDQILAGDPDKMIRQLRQLAKVVDRLVPYHDGHIIRVTFYSLAIGMRMGLPQEDLLTLEVAALLHDFGKLGVDEYTLEKEDQLSDDEVVEIHHHAERGFHILSGFAKLEQAAVIIRDHHEKYDGSGYPAKLKGEAIGLLSRIVAIANHYDELCNPINIADALTPHEALSLMFARLRSKFDPKLLQVFIRCLGV
ncbi:MAG TPA: hypothetical protein DEO67_09355, partial [Candidatus Edwardsbacteria bacterium]|nr:hypothetical protein [Candidatus Edwardsbacteria bacterium]